MDRWGVLAMSLPVLRRGLVGIAVFTGALLAWLLVAPASPAVVAAVDDLATIVGVLLALPLCFGWPRAAWHRRRAATARASHLLGLGIACFVLGDVIWSWYELVLGRETPFPSWADAAYVAGYPFLLLGILLLPGRRLSRLARARAALDGLLVMAAVAAFSWYFILGPTLLGGEGAALAKAVGAAYPLGDLVLVASLLSLAARTRDAAPSVAVPLLAGGLAVVVATDTAFAVLSLHGAYATGNPIDAGWPLGYMLVALGAAAIRRGSADGTSATRAAAPQDRPRLAVLLLPYALVPAVGLLLLRVDRAPGDPALDAGVRLACAALVGALLLRQVVAIGEGGRLQRALDARNAALAEANGRLTALATIDPLSGLPNHRALVAALERELERARRYRQPFAVLFLDLDHFKALNDAHGHAAGDAALREFGRLAGTGLRAVDTLGRWGGEEFVALLPQADADEATAVAERVRAAVAAAPFGVVGAHLTCSIGVAAYPAAADDRDALIAAADAAMYAAKRLGRNQVRVAGSPEVAAWLDGPLAGGGRDEAALAGTVEALAGLVHERDAYTGRHTDEVAGLALQLALALDCAPAEARLIALAARLHDIGKVALPDAVLQKPGRLTPVEWALVRRHPLIGAEVVGRVPALRSLAPLVRGHHERWDGAGYPDGLAGARIPLGARILAVADAYAAMTSERVYQGARPAAAALAELQRGAGSQFDPAVVAGLAWLLRGAPVAPDRARP